MVTIGKIKIPKILPNLSSDIIRSGDYVQLDVYVTRLFRTWRYYCIGKIESESDRESLTNKIADEVISPVMKRCRSTCRSACVEKLFSDASQFIGIVSQKEESE